MTKQPTQIYATEIDEPATVELDEQGNRATVEFFGVDHTAMYVSMPMVLLETLRADIARALAGRSRSTVRQSSESQS